MRKKKIHWGTLWLRFARKCRLHPPCNWHDTGYKSQCKGYAKHMTRIPSENGVLGCKCNHSGNHAGGCECVSHRRSTFNIKHFFFYPYRECMYCNVRGVDTLLLLKCNMGIFLFLQAMGGIISPRWCNNYTRWLQNVMLMSKSDKFLYELHIIVAVMETLPEHIFFSVLRMRCTWPLDDRGCYFSWSGGVSAE